MTDGDAAGRARDEEGTPAMVAGMQPDEDVQRWLEEEEEKRKAREEAEGKGVTAVVYDPGTPAVVGKGTRAVVLFIVLLVVVVPLLYYVAIPRADAELVIQYHEGITGGIAVDARIENHGTREMSEVSIVILVQDSSDTRMAEPTAFEGVVGAHSDAPMDAVTFTGDQWDTYHIFVEWSFECAGQRYQGTEHFDTEGDAMNLWFHQQMAP